MDKAKKEKERVKFDWMCRLDKCDKALELTEKLVDKSVKETFGDHPGQMFRYKKSTTFPDIFKKEVEYTEITPGFLDDFYVYRGMGVQVKRKLLSEIGQSRLGKWVDPNQGEMPADKEEIERLKARWQERLSDCENSLKLTGDMIHQAVKDTFNDHPGEVFRYKKDETFLDFKKDENEPLEIGPDFMTDHPGYSEFRLEDRRRFLFEIGQSKFGKWVKPKTKAK